MNINNTPNNQSTWNTAELRDYCSPAANDSVKIYLSTFIDKIKRIRYAINKIENQPILTSSNDFPIFRIESLIYLESIAYNVHSLADVMAHIISTLILTPLFQETNNSKYTIDSRKVTLHNILNKLENLKNSPDETWKKDYYEHLFNSIENLRNHDDFKFIEAFVNTIKHRNLVPEKLSGTLLKQKWIFDKFEKDGTPFDTIDQDSLFKYAKNIINLHFEIGQNINRYCHAKKNRH